MASPDRCRARRSDSGVDTTGRPSRQTTTHSFWKFDLDPVSPIVAQPLDHRAPAQKTFGGAALHLDHLAGEQPPPGLGLSIAAIGSAWRRLASLTACPRLIALVVVRGMPHFFTSAPVRGALQVAAIEPNSVQTLRLTRSIHFHVADG